MDIQKLNNTLSNIDKPFVAILIGPPLSGKDTALSKLDVDFEMISRDQLILDVHGSDDYTTAFQEVNQKEVDTQLRAQLKDLGNSDKNVVINMTNLTPKRRKFNLSFFKNHYKIGIIFPLLEKEEYDRRNAKRVEEENKHIPHYVLTRMIASYKPISESEGFDKVISL